MTETPESRWITVLGTALCVGSAALAALVEVCLVPLYVGAHLVPVTVLLTAATNVGLPLVVRWLGAGSFVPFLPVAAWIATVIGLSLPRPEGDVLLPGGGGQGTVGIAVLLVGAVAGIGTAAVQSGVSRPPGTGTGSRGDASSRQR